MPSRRSLFSFVPIALLALASRAKDVVVDDIDKAWTYSPTSSWGAISEKNPCTACNTQPDPKQAQGGTWHDLSKGGSAQLSFEGSGVVVYAICPKAIYRSNFTFYLDNEPAGKFLAPEGGCDDYEYRQVIYRRSGLKVGPHIFQVNNWIAPGEEYSSSDLVIDYALVTPGASESSSSGHSAASSATTSSTRSSTSIQPPPTSSPTTPSGKTTIFDDVDSAWTYEGPWGEISAANPCPDCITKPDASKAHETTWHDLSQAGSATLAFTGSGVKIYAICPGPLSDGGAFSSNFAFTIDGKADGTFTGEPKGCTSYVYSQLVYEVSGLAEGSHNFTIANVMVESGNTSDLILDYAVVESADTPGSTQSSPTTQLPTFPSLTTTPLETSEPDAASVLAAPAGLFAALALSLFAI